MSKFQQVVSANSEVIELFRSNYSQYNTLESLLKQNRIQKVGRSMVFGNFETSEWMIDKYNYIMLTSKTGWGFLLRLLLKVISG